MSRLLLTRRITFAAAHRYHRAGWSEERNAAVFGACAHPHFHGHSYRCDVTVTGTLSEETGFVADLGLLDSLLEREVRQRFDHRNINLDVEEFGEGGMIPTGENLARFIADKLQAALDGSGTSLVRVTVAEDDTLSSTWEAEA